MSYSKKEKLKELIWFIGKNFDHQLYQTKLWKLAFFAEADFYQKYQTTLTGVGYIKNEHGPTPSYKIARQALEELEHEGLIIKDNEGAYHGLGEMGLKALDTKAQDAITTTCGKYYKLSTQQVCLLTHRDPIYLAAEKRNDLLDFSFVSYREQDTDEGESPEDQKFEKITLSPRAQQGLLRILGQ